MNPVSAAVRESWRTPIPIIAYSTTLIQTLTARNPLTRTRSRAENAAMAKLAYIALRAAVTAATSLSIFGQNSSRIREVGLGVESDRPRVCIKVCLFYSIPLRKSAAGKRVIYFLSRDFLQMLGDFEIHRRHLRASPARRAAFLRIPAAILADQTRRQAIHYLRHHLHDARRQAAIFSVEVRALQFLAGRRQPKNFGRRRGSGHGQHIPGRRQDLIQVYDLRAAVFFRLNHAQNAAIPHIRLGAGTQFFHDRSFVWTAHNAWTAPVRSQLLLNLPA